MDTTLEIKQYLQNWTDIVAEYQKPKTKKAVVQILNSFLPFFALWILMYFSLDWSYGITLALGFLNAFFLVRIFIIQHDCGHQSFLKSRRWNNVIGFMCSFFSSIPYKYWARSHSFHHAHAGELDNRGIGDITVLTVAEYKKLSPWKQFRYRLYRNPFVIFVLGPIYYCFYNMRIPIMNVKNTRKVKISQVFNNIYMALVYVLLAVMVGVEEFFLIQVPIVVMFFIIAIWFFYVQHQHEDTYIAWKENWEYLLAAIKGSSYYKLPKVFQWLTGNIGFHHIHHLSSKIPNYNLERCAKENPILEKYVTVLTFKDSLKCIFSNLWDEEKQKMISFKEFSRRYKTKK